MKPTKLISIFLLLIFTGCVELKQFTDYAMAGEKPLTQTDIIAGLKEALIVGTNNSANILSNPDGYYKPEFDISKLLK